MDVSWPGHKATVFVALAAIGRTPAPRIAGNERNDPPPATAFRAPARNDAITSHARCGGKESAVMKSGGRSRPFSVYVADQALQIFGLWNGQDDGMVRRSAAAFQQAYAASGVGRRSRQSRGKVRIGDGSR